MDDLTEVHVTLIQEDRIREIVREELKAMMNKSRLKRDETR